MYNTGSMKVVLTIENIERFYAQEAERRGQTASTMNALRDKARAGTLSAGEQTVAQEIAASAILAAMDWT
jgi:hypothetical protein